MNIILNQKDQVLLGDPIHIRVETEALETVHVYLRRCYFDGDIDYSFASFEPVNGIVDTAKSKPLSGTYTKADISGLFWSQSNTGLEYNLDIEHLEELSDADQGYFIIDIIQNEDHQVYKFEIIRETSSIKMMELEVVPGRLYYTENDMPQGVMIHVAGEAGIEGVEVNAKLLASKGIATLALPICSYSTLKDEFSEIPLETVLDAIDYVKSLEFIDAHRIGLIGGSRGAELALKVASLRNDIKLVVASNPCDVINQSVVKQLTKSKSSWTLAGKPVTYSKIKKVEVFKLYFNRIISQRSQSMQIVYNHNVQMIDVGLITAKVLLLAGSKDDRWQSLYMAKRIKSSIDCGLNIYESGQVLGGPGCLPTTSFEQLSFSLGGTPEENGIAQNQSWQDVINFIKSSL
jgi:hypothetical protein